MHKRLIEMAHAIKMPVDIHLMVHNHPSNLRFVDTADLIREWNISRSWLYYPFKKYTCRIRLFVSVCCPSMMSLKPLCIDPICHGEIVLNDHSYTWSATLPDLALDCKFVLVRDCLKQFKQLTKINTRLLVTQFVLILWSYTFTLKLWSFKVIQLWQMRSIHKGLSDITLGQQTEKKFWFYILYERIIKKRQ